MALAIPQTMFEQTATTAQAAAKPDAGYKSWSASLGKAVMRLAPDERTAGPIPTFGQMVRDTALSAQNAHAYSPQDMQDGAQLPDIAYEASPDSDEYTFGDVIDMINPLQHLPLIGTIYRKFSGDTIKPMSNIIGGAIFGGPVGAIASTVNVVAKSTTGKDIAENAFAFVGIDVTPAAAKPRLTYDGANAFAPVQNMANANLQITSAAMDAYRTAADGRKSFAARTISTENWNA